MVENDFTFPESYGMLGHWHEPALTVIDSVELKEKSSESWASLKLDFKLSGDQSK